MIYTIITVDTLYRNRNIIQMIYIYIYIYINDRLKNELAHLLLIGGTHNKQGSNDARV